MDVNIESARNERRRSSLHDKPCDIVQATDSSESDVPVPQTGSGRLSRRPKQSRHMTSSSSSSSSSGRAHHQRAHTAPHHKEARLGSSSSSSSLTIDSGSSHQEKRLVTGTYSCHISCRVSPDKPGYFEYLKPYSVFRPPLRRSRSVPKSFSDSYRLQHPDLSQGQKTYLWHTAAVYSMSNMKTLQERRYKQLLQHQVDTGFHTQEECDRYLGYLLGSRKRQYAADPSVWREPPKIPVRPKYFHQTPPSKSQSPRDYRFFPTGYEEKSSSDDKGKTEDVECDNQTENKGHTPGQGQAKVNLGKGKVRSGERSHSAEAGQLECTEKGNDGNVHGEGQDSHPVSSGDDEQSLSDSMRGVSLFYDPKRKATVRRGQREEQESGRENAEREGSPNSPQKSHQNCFWGSH